MHAPAVGMRLWLVEALHPADLAKQMLGLGAAKPVGGEVILARYQREAFMRDEQMEIPARRANRAIAIKQFGPRVAQRLAPHRAAMAAPGDANERAHSTVTDLARLRGWSTSVPFTTAT